ncbi:MAG: YbhB/YbcL family Raf kinase inhibitor-like protein [Anaerovoracaceae bacterium]|jgi:phosphatidylethanolamine-binding protein (PEBP) family uncharacterized protein
MNRKAILRCKCLKSVKFLLVCTLAIAIAFAFAACGGENDSGGKDAGDSRDSSQSKTTITVTSDNLHDGVWDTEITHLSGGRNESPELTWNAVDGAEEYAIIMLDPDAENWMHWRVTGLKDTHLDEGKTPAEGKYRGPNPPKGTHRYVVTVYALKAPADSVPGNFGGANKDAGKIREAFDTSDGETGNILCEGTLEGTVSAEQ